MAKILKMPSLAIINGFRGTLDFYYYMGLAVVRKWPKSPGSLRTPAVRAQWAPFLEAVELAGQLDFAMIEYYKANASGTKLTWKDVFFTSYLSGLNINT